MAESSSAALPLCPSSCGQQTLRGHEETSQLRAQMTSNQQREGRIPTTKQQGWSGWGEAKKKYVLIVSRTFTSHGFMMIYLSWFIQVVKDFTKLLEGAIVKWTSIKSQHGRTMVSKSCDTHGLIQHGETTKPFPTVQVVCLHSRTIEAK